MMNAISLIVLFLIVSNKYKRRKENDCRTKSRKNVLSEDFEKKSASLGAQVEMYQENMIFIKKILKLSCQ